MSVSSLPIWKEAPFVRLLLPLVMGILLQYYAGLPVAAYGGVAVSCLFVLVVYSYLPVTARYRYHAVPGVAIQLLFLSTGGIAACYQDIRKEPGYSLAGQPLTCIASVSELVTANQTFIKARAAVHALYPQEIRKDLATVIIYFRKDAAGEQINHYSRIVFQKPMQAIPDNSNPGGFDYRRYCAFQGIAYQVYLKKGEYTLLAPGTGNVVNRLLYRVREAVIRGFTRYIPGKKEAGMAEALLIGYRNHLDKTLVRAYSNTGVVHIIAISGLHLGLIYWLLSRVCAPLGRFRSTRMLKPLLIFSGLWLFSIVAGGSPSVLRSAVMFSFIVAGDTFKRNTSIYNSLAGSAFLLLCYNPFWLWDAGFQLSYLAVLSIVVFMRPVYSWLFVQNRLLDSIWKGCAVSIAAQLLTTPVSIGLFHQFPNYFLVANIVAVPLSSLIVLCEIALCACLPVPPLATAAGHVISHLIRLMNRFVEHTGRMPFSVTGELQLSVPEILLLYVVIGAAGLWLMQKNKTAMLVALSALCCFYLLRFMERLDVARQQKLVVYHVPKHRAIDIFLGSHYLFMGDTALLKSGDLQHAYLAPSRMLFRSTLSQLPGSMSSCTDRMVQVAGKRIALVSTPGYVIHREVRLTVECVIITGNPNLRIAELMQAFNTTLLVFDSSNPAWKISKWKAECGQSGLRWHSVAEKGAFILNLN